MTRGTIDGYFREKHPLYACWANMKQRCFDVNYHHYRDYGGRGITVCSDWLDFDLFYRDMSNTWKEGFQLERVDNDKNYAKDNCTWATAQEQSQNRRSTVLTLELAARIKNDSENGLRVGSIAKKHGLKYHTVWNVLAGRTWSNA